MKVLGIDGGTPDGNQILFQVNAWGGNAVEFHWTTQLPAGAISVNSITLRVRAQIIDWVDDNYFNPSHNFSYVGDPDALTGSVSWYADDDSGAGLANRELQFPDSVTIADVNNGFVFVQNAFASSNMGPDGTQLQLDTLEIEVDYNIGINAEIGAFTIDGGSPTTKLLQFGDFAAGGLSIDFSGTQAVSSPVDFPRNAGDLLIAVSASVQAISSTPSGGWILVEESITGAADWHIWYKISDGTETNLTVNYSASTAYEIALLAFHWQNRGTPIVDSNENETNISGTVTSQASGAVTPSAPQNILLAFHGGLDMSLNFTGAAIDGSWIEDVPTWVDASAPGFFTSRKTNATGSQEATFSSTDTGTSMYGAIVAFGVTYTLDATTPGAFAINGADASLATFGDFRRHAKTSYLADTIISCDLGSNPISGSLLIFVISANNVETVATPPSGFTLLHIENSINDTHVWYYKISDGTEQTAGLTWDTAATGIAKYAEYIWGLGTPSVIKNEDVTNVNSVTNSQPSGAATPTDTTNLCIVIHGTGSAPFSNAGEAVDGAWIEDTFFIDTGGVRATCKFSHLKNAALSSQEATHTDTDTGDFMYGAIAVFEPGSVDPILDAVAGAFVVTGIDANLEQGYEVIAETGAFVATGIDANLEYGYEVIAALAGSFVVTGIDATLTEGGADPVLDALAGAFVVSGVDANLEQGYAVDALTGAFVISGVDANLEFHDRFSSEAGSFLITGIDANLEIHHSLNALAGTFSITGIAATFPDFVYKGGFTNDVNDSTLNLTHGLTINEGDLVVAWVHRNGSNTIVSTQSWDAETGSEPAGETCIEALMYKVAGASEPATYQWTFSGSDNVRAVLGVWGTRKTAVVDSPVNRNAPTSSVTPVRCDTANGETISDKALSVIVGGRDGRPGDGSYTTATQSYVGVTGSDVRQETAMAHRYFETGEVFSGDVDITPSTGNDNSYGAHISFVAGSVNPVLTADAGTFLVSGIAANLEQGYSISALAGSFTVTGIDANLEQHLLLNAETGTFAVTGIDAILRISMAADAGTYIISGIDANLEWNQDVVGGTGAFLIAGVDAGLIWSSPFEISLSASIGTGGENTTDRLTGGGTHGGGRIRDDANITNTIDLATDESGEWAWVIKGTGDAVQGVEYSFRLVFDDDTPLNTYSVEPTWTIATGDFVLTADAGSVSITGIDANLEYGYAAIAEIGVFSITGLDANLEQGYALIAETGVYAVSGIAANLEQGYSFAAETGIYTITGVDATFLLGLALPAETGIYTITGADATFPLGLVLPVDAGTFVVSGADANLEQGYLIPADTGSFVITGFVATLTDSGSDPILTAEIGAVLITGIAAGLARQIPISAEAGSVLVTGVAATLTKKKSIIAEVGLVSIAGQDANLEYHHVLAAETAAFLINGQDANLEQGYAIEALAGSYLITGQDANLEQGYAVIAEAGSVLISGQIANLKYGYSVEALAGSYLITGQDANLEFHDRFSSEAGAFLISGQDANLEYHHNLTAETGAFLIDGQDATLTVAGNVIIVADVGTYIINGIDANLEQGYALIAETGTFVITGQVANLEWNQDVVGGAGAFIITGLDATLTVTGSIILTADAGSILVSGQIANLEQGYVLIAETGSFVITGVDANLVEGGTIILTAEAGSIIVSGQDANLEWNQDVVGGTGAFIITGIAANLEHHYLVSSEAGTFLISGQDANLERGRLLLAEAGAYVITGFDVANVIGPYQPLNEVSVFLEAPLNVFINAEEHIVFIEQEIILFITDI